MQQKPCIQLIMANTVGAHAVIDYFTLYKNSHVLICCLFLYKKTIISAQEKEKEKKGSVHTRDRTRTTCFWSLDCNHSATQPQQQRIPKKALIHNSVLDDTVKLNHVQSRLCKSHAHRNGRGSNGGYSPLLYAIPGSVWSTQQSFQQVQKALSSK